VALFFGSSSPYISFHRENHQKAEEFGEVSERKIRENREKVAR
jgi:hypothetical protein